MIYGVRKIDQATFPYTGSSGDQKTELDFRDSHLQEKAGNP